MNVNVYKIKCLTNLHVGSGEVNYNVVDNEVEKDAVTGYPVVHASGLKGALREHFEKKMDESDIKDIFGQKSGAADIQAGSYKFFDAKILGRPMRVNYSSTNPMASIMVVSVDSVNAFIKMMNDFGITSFGTELINPMKEDKDNKKKLSIFGNKNFLCNISDISIEGEPTETISDISTEGEPTETISDISTEGEPTETISESNDVAKIMKKLENIIGTEYAIVKDFNEYDLPVVARNKLDNGESKHLWYEEVVPHDSIFYTLILTPDNNMNLNMDDIIQVGGHASIGCGFTKWTKINGQKSAKEGTANEQNKSE